MRTGRSHFSSPRHKLRASTWAVLVGAISTARCGLAATTIANFDTDPSWDGLRNRLVPVNPPIVTQNFGFSATSNAGGPSGELGGSISRTTTPAWYAGPTSKTLNDTLFATGKIAMPSQSSSAGLHFGWFNSQRQGWRPWNELGFRLDGQGTFANVLVDVMSQTWRASGLNAGTLPTPLKIPFDGSVHTWTLAYNPSGTGTVTFTLDNLPSAVLPLDATLRADGAVFDRFGLFNQQVSSGSMRLYMDNIQYDGVTQNFNTSSNGWQEVGSRASFPDPEQRGAQNFGYSNTHRAGGSNTGEIGGMVWRATPHNEPYYGGQVTGLSLSTPMTASGKVSMHRGASDGGMYFGFFNKQSMENSVDVAPQTANVSNIMGVHIDGPSAVGWYFSPVYAVADGVKHASSDGALIYPNDQVHNFTLNYNPFANGGTGKLSVTLDGVYREVNLSASDRAQGATFDHFGLFSLSPDGHYVECYFDDLSYTSSPTPQWIGSAGSWLTAGNWYLGAPNGIGAEADFLGAITAPTSVLADTAITVGMMRFENVNTYNTAGNGSLTLQVSSGTARVDVTQGTHKINLPFIIASDTIFNVASGATLKISDPITVNAGKSVTATGGGLVMYESTIDVLSNASITFGNSTHANSLSLGSGARGTIASHGATAVRVLHLDNLSVASDAKLDLTDNALAVASSGGTSITSIRDRVATAFAGGTWNGNGITSSTAAANAGSAHKTGIGIGDSSGMSISNFLGEAVTPGTILLRYTYVGDANLDGVITSTDFAALAANFNATGKFWYQGDFNYDGTVNALDFNALATNFGQALATPALGTLVPEPQMVGLIGATGMMVRRRRNKSPSPTSARGR